jgi:hypothetical protein
LWIHLTLIVQLFFTPSPGQPARDGNGAPVRLEQKNSVAGKALLYAYRVTTKIGDFEPELVDIPS